MFRPCMWAIIRLFKEILKWLYYMCGNSGRGTRSRLTPHILYSRFKILWTTWSWPTHRVEICSYVLYIATNFNIVVFMTVCICRYTHATDLYYWPNTTGVTHLKMCTYSWPLTYVLFQPPLPAHADNICLNASPHRSERSEQNCLCCPEWSATSTKTSRLVRAKTIVNRRQVKRV